MTGNPLLVKWRVGVSLTSVPYGTEPEVVWVFPFCRRLWEDKNHGWSGVTHWVKRTKKSM